MNVLWILVVLVALCWILAVWGNEDEDEETPAPSRPTSGEEIGRTWREALSSGIARVVLMVAALALAVAIEFGPFMVFDALSGDGPGHADRACLARVAGTGSGPSATAARALVREAPGLFCSEGAAVDLERMRLDADGPR